MTAVTDHWRKLVTVALLGTDRRDPPDPPPGPLGDAVADALAPTASARLLTSVATTVAVRRAGLVPRAPVAPLVGPAPDDRPMVSTVSARRWRSLVASWPVLEDEWLATVDRRGRRLPPDLLVDLLRRHRSDDGRRARVVALGGPLAAWLVEHQPDLAGRNTGRAATAPASVPARPVPPELLPLLDASPADVVAVLVAGVRDGRFGVAHRTVLVNFVARMRQEACHPLADALRAATVEVGQAGLLHLLADLAETRHMMLEELT